MKIALLILGAGSSSRMGITKQLLPVGKTTLLGVVIENALASKANNVFCVLGANAKNITESIANYAVETLVNQHYKSGISSSIIAGIEYLQKKNFDTVLIMLGDQPFVDANYIDLMIDTFKKHPKKIIASSYNDQVGVPVIFSETFFPQFKGLHGDKGAKIFLNAHEEDIIRLENSRLIDIDTLDEYREFLKSIDIQ